MTAAEAYVSEFVGPLGRGFKKHRIDCVKQPRHLLVRECELPLHKTCELIHLTRKPKNDVISHTMEITDNNQIHDNPLFVNCL